MPHHWRHTGKYIPQFPIHFVLRCERLIEKPTRGLIADGNRHLTDLKA
jgi:hypothetical protein